VIVKPRAGSGSRGIRLIERRAELEALERDGTLLVQEHLPGPEYSLDVLARADGHVAAVVPRERLKVDSGIAGHRAGPCSDDALETASPRGRRSDRARQRRQRPGQARHDDEPALLGGQRPLPRARCRCTSPPAVDMPRLGGHARQLGARRSRTVPCPSRSSRWCATSRSGFFAFDDIATCNATRRRSRREPLADLHVHSTFSDGPRHRSRTTSPECESLGLVRARLRRPRAGRHRLGPDYVAAVQRCAADTEVQLRCGHRGRSCSTRRARSTCPDAIDGVDAIYVADHQVPLPEGPDPSARGCASGSPAGDLSAERVVDAILTATRSRSTARSAS
jgi:hypothetical protein